MEMARKIYDFIGHDIHQDVVDHLSRKKRKRRSGKLQQPLPFPSRHNSINQKLSAILKKHSESQGNRSEADQKIFKDNKAALEEMNMFGVNKRKNETSIHKLQLVNEHQAQQINDLCRQYLDVFEYQ